MNRKFINSDGKPFHQCEQKEQRTSNGNIIEFGMMYSGVKHVIQAAIIFLRTSN
jgi:hypothetical protein